MSQSQKQKQKEIEKQEQAEVQMEQKKQQEQEEGQEQEIPFQEIKLEPVPEQQLFVEDNPEMALEHKNKGNQCYKNGETQNAISQYQSALQYTSQENTKMKSILYSNIAINLIKQQQWKKAISYCTKSLKNDYNYIKARLNLARCYEEDDKIEEALEEYKKLKQMNSSDKFVQQKIKTLQVKVDELNQKKKQQVIGGLKNLGNSVLGYFGLSLDNFKMEQGQGGGYNVSFKQ